MKKTTKVVNDGREVEKKRALLRGHLNIRFDDIIRRVEQGTLNYGLVMLQLQAIAEGRVKILERPETDQDLSNIPNLELWRKFYSEYFGLEMDFLRMPIPPKPTEGAWRLLVILNGLTNNQVYSACFYTFKGKCWRIPNDLDSGVPMNERDPRNGSYAIWVRDIEEPDEVHLDKTAGMIKKQGLKTETLLERMLHGLKYFAETGEHLDQRNATLCFGSRLLNSEVPLARRSDGEFRILSYSSVDSGYDLGPREVVAM